MLRTVVAICVILGLASVASAYNELELQYRLLESQKRIEAIADKHELRELGHFYQASQRHKGSNNGGSAGGAITNGNNAATVDFSTMNGPDNAVRGFMFGLQFNRDKFSNCYYQTDSLLTIISALIVIAEKIYNPAYIAAGISLVSEVSTYVSGVAVYCKFNQLVGIITTTAAEGVSGLAARVGVSSLSSMPNYLNQFIAAKSDFERAVAIGLIV